MTFSIGESDKDYWHRYVDFYEEQFTALQCHSVLEFGVWRGASIRWLMNRFPAAKIYGADILDGHESWPRDERVTYFVADQGDALQIDGVFDAIGDPLDLVIEDGSHHPKHQRNCLVRSIGRIRSGGMYILEDVHTSHPSHPEFRKCKPLFRPLIGVLHLLLAIDHLKAADQSQTKAGLQELSVDSLFDESDVASLFESIDSVKIYKRSHLPKKCFSCGGESFNYAALKCKCGVDLYAETDSMSAIIRVK